ncbi:PQQ-binding-like beta-propeller repeat protein [Paenibacillus glycanilyticus]|uniref:outer membrane protein assembly factor BamB family protein n=1 Tax=Paenibacillus glycanilyticus TaxID=126569 RepID=UPI00203FF12E|nr:PQQ-binding-like beta-propeller repeat protein [Paenibacillus glycanilyticus]MCM3630537.1 PQQ-binding-like beta-propeller repeat protein [Paenibacillus glycanilyticus]
MSFKRKFLRSKKTIQGLTTFTMAGLALAAVIKPAMAEIPQTTVTGVVFADQNGNGIQDKNEKGLSGVSVSDGATISITDKQGKYRLVVNPDRRLTDIVFVTVPSGYKAQESDNKIPQFYQNLGQLTQNESRTANFALQPAPQSKNPNFEFAGIADVHVQAGTTNNRERLTGQLAELNALTGSPAFITISGDITNGASDAEFKDFLASSATSKLPVYPAVGNHDFTGGADFSARIDRYRTYLGPEWYSFDYADKHFIVLENNMGMREADQMAWLTEDLKQTGKHKEIVVITHRPFNNPQTPDAAEAQKYIDLLGKYNTRLVLMGHTHVNDVATDTIESADHVVTNSSSYTIDQTPNGFRVISFKGSKETHPYKMYGVDKNLVIVNPAPGSSVPQGNVQLQVNAYNTTSRVTEAKYRIDGGQWHTLKQSGEMTWSADWKAGKEKLGKHTIEVRVTDDGKQTWSESSSFTLVKASEAALPVQGADWPMFHGNAQHTGEAIDALAPDLKLAWSHLTDGTILTSSPAVVNGNVYIGTRDENGTDQNRVLALDLTSGDKKWEFKPDAQIQASPAVENNIVYASSIRGTLYALDAKKGNKLWVKTIGEKDVNRAWMYYSPTVADGIVYQAYSSKNGGEIMALNAKTGETVWTAKLAGGWIAESSPVVKDGKVYVGSDGGYLIALDAKDGKELWRKQPAGGWMHSMPAAADGKVFMGYGGGLIVALDADTGAEVWRYQSKAGPSLIPGDATGSSPAVVNGVVYMGFPNGSAEALKADTGEKLWSRATDGGIISSAAVSGDTVYIGSNDGNLYALNKQNGEIQWSYKIGAWVASSPAISGNALVVGAFDGNIYAFTSSVK